MIFLVKKLKKHLYISMITSSLDNKVAELYLVGNQINITFQEVMKN